MAWLCTPCIWTSRDLFWISIGGARRTRPRCLLRRHVLNRRRHPRQPIDEKFPTCVAGRSNGLPAAGGFPFDSAVAKFQLDTTILPRYVIGYKLRKRPFTGEKP